MKTAVIISALFISLSAYSADKEEAAEKSKEKVVLVTEKENVKENEFSQEIETAEEIKERIKRLKEETKQEIKKLKMKLAMLKGQNGNFDEKSGKDGQSVYGIPGIPGQFGFPPVDEPPVKGADGKHGH